MREGGRDGWLVPDWPAPAGVRAVCSTRTGGVSSAPYASLNLGDHVGDDPAHVAANRAIFQQSLQARPVFLQQVHGTQVLQLDAATPDACVADACITSVSGVACTVMVADCLPVLLTTTTGDWVAAAHAGWRGLAGSGGVGVLEKTLREKRGRYPFLKKKGSVPFFPSFSPFFPEVIAWLGPCIGPQAFEVGAEVRTAFVAADGQAAPCFTALASGKWLADLAGLARQRLRAAGIRQIYGNDSSPLWCTVANATTFFSHRRDGVSGRFAASVWKM
ncbi:MAG: laccase domain-containing protein [Rhodoferax sp.]|nr:laccase domain-containing protein [Rhodoferax sp.]